MATAKKTATKATKPPAAKRGRPEKYPGGSVQVFFFLPKEHLQEARDAIDKFLTSYQPKKNTGKVLYYKGIKKPPTR